jgi:endonuclease/exonuclease/phosphatase family metal-dependent hydrolase
MPSFGPAPTRPQPQRLGPWLVAGLTLLLATGLFSRVFPRAWSGEVASHFAPFAALVAVPLLGLLWRQRAWAWLGLSAALTGLCAFPWLQLRLSPSGPLPREPSWTAVSANLLWGSPAGQALPEWLAELQPEVVFLCELDPASKRSLESWAPAQGYAPPLIWPPENQWTDETIGRALLARQPFESTAVHWPGPILEGRLTLAGRSLRLLGAHPLRPGNPALTVERNRVLAGLATLCYQDPAVLVLGDLNCTEASPRFGALLSNGDLIDTRAGRGWFASWRVYVPHLRWPLLGLRLPLDHILHGAALATHSRSLGPDLGADHLPAVARVGWR